VESARHAHFAAPGGFGIVTGKVGFVILILDFGSQYTQLIARRVREAHVYCEIHPYNLAIEKIRAMRPRGIILSGGPASLYEADAPDIAPEVLRVGCPVLGICYGMYVIAQHLGAHSAGSRHDGSTAARSKELLPLRVRLHFG